MSSGATKKTEKQKMLAGELYDAMDAELVAERHRTRLLLRQLNDTLDPDAPGRADLTKALFGADTDVVIQPPFYCDYGSNIGLGSGVFMNFNCVILDVAKVTIGHRVLIGPNVQIYAATHPLQASVRRQGLEAGKTVMVGDDVWIGGGAIVCPGVAIGERAVIGAGSVVTRDIPADTFAAGNPCRVIRSVSEERDGLWT
jgi:maltose O-acetyltransferase